jgi:hypothetical protein
VRLHRLHPRHLSVISFMLSDARTIDSAKETNTLDVSIQTSPSVVVADLIPPNAARTTKTLETGCIFYISSSKIAKSTPSPKPPRVPTLTCTERLTEQLAQVFMLVSNG